MHNDRQAVCFFNNCHRRDHIALHGARAFYDLENSGRQATQARRLLPGQVCVVGAYGDDDTVVFRWYSFSHEALLPDNDRLMRVFFGRSLVSQALSKGTAARSARYAALFKRTGDFKNGSVFWGNVPVPNRPARVRERGGAGAASSLRRGAGFGDPTENRLVEAAAMRVVKRWYTEKGWSVSSRERDRCGFDLACSKNGTVEHVEVKGVRGSEPCFIITAGEVQQARHDCKFILMVVTSTLAPSPRITKYSGAEFSRRFSLSPIQYRASLNP